MKAKSRFLGIDDAPFRFSDETVPVVGVVVQAPSYIEGVLTTLAEVDGHDATERIASMVRRSRYRAGLAAILIDGTAVGGFNVIDIDAVRAAVDRPVVTVTRKKPNLGSIETALRRRFDDWQERLPARPCVGAHRARRSVAGTRRTAEAPRSRHPARRRRSRGGFRPLPPRRLRRPPPVRMRTAGSSRSPPGASRPVASRIRRDCLRTPSPRRRP